MMLGWLTCAHDLARLVNLTLEGTGLVLRRQPDGSWTIEREHPATTTVSRGRYIIGPVNPGADGVSYDQESGLYYVPLPQELPAATWVIVYTTTVDAVLTSYHTTTGQVPESDDATASPRTMYEVVAMILDNTQVI